ncbi:MAG: SpoIIE family protein phosphatase [Eubacteriales bacterium]|nr:SpoIIE family protein phosphatase [Eubacteriales bacterium]
MKFLKRMVMSFLLFIVVAYPFKQFAFLMPGVTELRPENVFPPVLGILFGIPGAIGCALGNVVGDLMDGTRIYTLCFGFIANFLYSYIAYKLWYTFPEKDGAIALPKIFTFDAVLKFLVIIFIDSLFIAIMIMLLCEDIGVAPAADTGLLLFYGNFDFAAVLGIPVLSVAGNLWDGFEIPKRGADNDRLKTANKISSIIIPFVVLEIGIGYFITSKFGSGVIHSGIARLLMYVVMILLFIYALRPRTAEVVDRKQKNVIFSLKARTTVVFQAIGLVIIVLTGILAYHLSHKNAALTRLELWNDVLFVVNVAFNVVFAVILAALYFIERLVTDPIEILSEMVERFSKNDHLNTEENNKIRETCRTIESKDEIQALAMGFDNMVGEVEDYVRNLRDITAEKEKTRAELELAKNIQAGALPKEFPPFEGHDEIELYASMTPAREVGGDFYDFYYIDDDHFALTIADVSGKGVPAALFMMVSKVLLKNMAMRMLSPGEILTAANHQLCENNAAEMFVTVWLGIYEISSGRLVCANAGHEFPAIKRADGSFELYHDKHSFVLAGMDGMKYKEYELVLGKGDIVFVYTDGVAEATDTENELFGTGRMLDALNAAAGTEPREIIEEVNKSIDRFVKDAPQFDDITMLAMKVK